MKQYFITPRLYHRINPVVKKPALAAAYFFIGFILYIIPILIWHYGMELFLTTNHLNSNLSATTFMAIFFFLYILLAYDSRSYLRFPYFLQKNLIDPKLRQDLENDTYIKATATITAIRHQQKAFFFQKHHQLQLQPHDDIHTSPIWFDLDLSIVFFFNPRYQNLKLDITEGWVGQEIEICYLPCSATLVQLFLIQQDDFSDLDNYVMIQTQKILLTRPPSRLHLSLNNIVSIQAIRQSQQYNYDLVIDTLYSGVYTIASNSLSFYKLELCLANKSDFLKYREFKNNINIQQQTLYEKKSKFPQLIKYCSLITQVLLFFCVSVMVLDIFFDLKFMSKHIIGYLLCIAIILLLITSLTQQENPFLD